MARDETVSNDLPADVQRFMERRIGTIEQLEVLMLLQHESTHSWDASGVAQSLDLTERQAADSLEALSRVGLMDVRIGATMLYRFSPVTEMLASEVKQVAEAYRDRRRALFALIISRRRRSLRDFSDAFKFTKDADDR